VHNGDNLGLRELFPFVTDYARLCQFNRGLWASLASPVSLLGMLRTSQIPHFLHIYE